jgi:hypothetical protein
MKARHLDRRMQALILNNFACRYKVRISQGWLKLSILVQLPDRKSLSA